MKYHRLLALLPCLLATTLAAQDSPDLTDANQKINYAFGLDIIQTFQQQEFDIDTQAFLAGMRDSLAGNPALTPAQKQAAFEEMQAILQVKGEARKKVVAAKNLVAGEAFLAANAKKEGVLVMKATAQDGTPSELQYKILKSGSGPSPRLTDTVEIHFVGTRIDGTEFDSSVRRGTPATFGLSDVIPGWRAALQKMKVGDKWQLFLPANLAFGEYGLPQLEPNMTLIFEVELLSFYTPVNNGAAKPPAPAVK